MFGNGALRCPTPKCCFGFSLFGRQTLIDRLAERMDSAQVFRGGLDPAGTDGQLQHHELPERTGLAAAQVRRAQMRTMWADRPWSVVAWESVGGSSELELVTHAHPFWIGVV